MSKNPLYTMENELFACLIRHFIDQFEGWAFDYLGTTEDNKHGQRDCCFLESNPLIAGFALSLGTIKIADEPVFIQKLARLLASSTYMYRAAHDAAMGHKWNPLRQTYARFTDASSRAEPYLATTVDSDALELQMLHFLQHCRQSC